MDGTGDWLPYFRRVVEETELGVNRLLAEFRVSLEWWLHGELNWPSNDWQQQFELLVEHSRFYGIEIASESQAAISHLIAQRLRNQELPSGKKGLRESVMLAMAVGDSANPKVGASTPDPSTASPETELEVAGEGPETTRAFHDKVQAVLDIIDSEVAKWWRGSGGRIQSRNARGWLFDYYGESRKGQATIVVDRSYSASDTALAIINEAYGGEFKSDFLKDWVNRGDPATRYAEAQKESFKQAAAEAGMIAEIYVQAVAGTTSAGDIVVTIDEISTKGLQWSQLWTLIPFLPTLAAGLSPKRLRIRIKGQRDIVIEGRVLNELSALPSSEQKSLLDEVSKEQNRSHAMQFLDKRLAAKRKAASEAAKAKAAKEKADQIAKAKAAAKAKAEKAAKAKAKREAKSKSTVKPKPTEEPGQWGKPLFDDPSGKYRGYQGQITGRPDDVYWVGNVEFDGYKNGVLLEAKGLGYERFMHDANTMEKWFKGSKGIIAQAFSQQEAAKGLPIEWHVAEKKFADLLRRAFSANSINKIKVIHTPPIQ